MAGYNVTIKDVYDLVERLETKMSKRFDENEKDIEELQNFKSRLAGQLSLISVISGAASAWIWQKISGQP